MTAGSLLRWGDLDERRRRGRLGSLRWLLRGAVGAGLAVLVWQVAAAERAFLAATIAIDAWVMIGTPFRMYWRSDSPLLARLPVPGRALFDVAVVRSARAALGAVVMLAPAAIVLGGLAPAIVGATALAAALLLPAVALGAGALVAGGKANALMQAVGGVEVAAPPTAWLGMLPGLAAAAVVLGILFATPILLGALAGGSVLAALAARGAAETVMPQAVREVAALDVQRLAHLEIDPPTRLERLVAARLSPGAALVHGKDARLLRRRFPMALVVGASCTLALWIVAIAAPASAWAWAGAIVVGFCGYAIVMAMRLVGKPIELPFLRTLPVGGRDAARAKLAYLATWTLLYPTLGALALAVREPIVAASVVGAAAVVLGIGTRVRASTR